MGVKRQCTRTGQCTWRSCKRAALPGWTTCKKHRDAGREVKPSPTHHRSAGN